MSDEGEKPHDPSEQKLRQARDKGDIPRSTEVNVLMAYAGAFLVLVVIAPHAMAPWLARASAFSATVTAPEGAVFDAARGWAGLAALLALGLLTLPAALVLLGLVVQRALIFTPSKLAPDIKRINPVKNAAQKFGPQGLVTFGLSLLKLCLTLGGAWWLYRRLLGWLSDAGSMRELQWLSGLGLMLRDALLLALTVTAVIALADLLWKRFDHRRRNRMSRKELQDEHKESEGDPQFKAVRRQRAVDIALGSMLADVAKADVVIVNPTHYAVALEWKRGSGRAPVCLAKGTDDVARRIRERAAEHGVPICPDPPCARALHAAMEIGDEIPVPQFAAVAAAIRFAEAMRRKARAGW